MLDIGSPKAKLMSTTVISGLVLWVPAQAANPSGVFIAIDPATTNATALDTTSPIYPLFGPETCPSYCMGGITGVFVSEQWSDFQSTSRSHGTTTITIDPNQNVSGIMSSINAIEAAQPGFTFQLTLGLKAGDNAAYKVPDMYAATGGSFGGTPPYLTTGVTVTKDNVEGMCGFGYDASNNVTMSGLTFATNGFPEQCVLRKDANNIEHCIPQPRMWGTDANSPTANQLYVAAYTQAMQDFVNFVNGNASYGGTPSIGHAIAAFKLAGIAYHDEEVDIPGDVYLNMPSNNGTTYTCGFATATNAEEIWTNQINPGPPFSDVYEAGILESTWLTLVQNAQSITGTWAGGSPSFIMDVVSVQEFPPVQPAHCSAASGTNCTYTGTGNSLLPSLTTGEIEYLIEDAVGAGGLPVGSLSIQSQNLQADTPDADTAVESTYGTNEVPCAMNALIGNAIGYQSGGTTIASAADKTAYLASISNAGSYGASYIELLPQDLEAFVNDTTDAIPFRGNSNFGTNTRQNIDMLAKTIAAADIVMAANAANSASGSLCPLPYQLVIIGGSPVNIDNGWTYP